MDDVKKYIAGLIERVSGNSLELTGERLANFLKTLSVENRSILSLHNRIEQRNKQLSDVQSTLRAVAEYDARKMSLVQFIKMKVGI